MQLNHLNLTVTSVPETHKFLKKYFEMEGDAGNNNIAFLTDGRVERWRGGLGQAHLLPALSSAGASLS